MNEVVTVLVNGGLAVVLLASGVLKFAAVRDAPQMWRRLHLPGVLAESPLPRLWPAAEIGLGAALLFVPAPWSTAVSALALAVTVAFLVVVVRVLRSGDSVACQCFGASDRAPIDRATVVRNAGLVGLAVIGLVGSFHGAVVGTALALDPVQTGTAQAAALVLAVVLGLRLVDHLRRRDSAIVPAEADGTAHAGRTELGQHLLPDLFGARPDVRRFVGADSSVLVFLSTTCGSCRAVAADLPRWRTELAEHGVSLRAVTSRPAAQALVTFPALGAFLHQDADDALVHSLGITDLPAAVLVGADGTPTVSQGPVVGPYAIADLVANVRVAEPVRS